MIGSSIETNSTYAATIYIPTLNVLALQIRKLIKTPIALQSFIIMIH